MSLEDAVKENTQELREVKALLMNLGKASAVADKATPAPKPEAAVKSTAAAPTPTIAAASAAPAASAANSEAKPLVYDDVKKVFFAYMNKAGVPAGQTFLVDKGLEHLTKATPEQYAGLIDDLNKLTAAVAA